MIFPMPKKEEYKDGNYILSDYESNTELLYLYEKYKNGNKDLELCPVNEYSEDEYKLIINSEGIKIYYTYESGKFRAVSTLRQLISDNKDTLPYSEIYDKPDYIRRGYMLDISRGRIPKVSTITRLIDILAELKYNEFLLYMENFCFKFSEFPEFTKDFDCLTPEDIKYLDKYCKDRFIELIPNQNCFGHMATWLEREELSYLEVTDGKEKTATLNIAHPDAIKFVEKLFDSVLPHFSSEYVNIGLDEAGGLGKFQLEEICNAKGKDIVFMDYLNQVAELIKRKYNKKVMFWSDMIYDAKESFKYIPENAIALNWGYDVGQTILAEGRCIALKEKEIPYYVCPGSGTWLSFTGKYEQMEINVQFLAEIGKRQNACGFLMTDWGNLGHPHHPVWSFVPLALASQYAWNIDEDQWPGIPKPWLWSKAHKYIDKYVFKGANVCEYLRRLQLWYLLEPERTPDSTICGFSVYEPLSVKVKPGFWDLEERGGDFYFDNIISYVEASLNEVLKEDFDENYKRQIYVNSKMVVISAELCKIRASQSVTKEKAEYLSKLIDDVLSEHRELWLRENFEKGFEDFSTHLENRKNELVELAELTASLQ